jgi:hypothetical protein
MHLLLIMICYAAAALAVVSVGVIGFSMLTSSTETMTTDAQRPKLVRRADHKNPGEQQPIDPPRAGAAFRYGPEVNHGRADTPVNYAQQALKEARSAYAWAPAVRYKQNPERRYRGGRIVDHGVQPSGH